MRPIPCRAVSEAAFDLAEGPVWDRERQLLLWVDVDAGRVHLGRLEDETVRQTRRLELPDTVGAVVPGPDGSLLVANHDSLVHLDAEGTELARWPVLPPGSARRLNDGACDPSGRFLVGSLSLEGTTGSETLVRLEHTGRLSGIDPDLTLSNGLGWSPDGATLYSVDSEPGVVWRRRYDVATGDVGPREVLLRVGDGSPDGLAVDAEGNLWLAVWGAGVVRCVTPDGELIAVIEVPAPHPTSVAFAGPDLDLLLITSARVALSARERRRHRDAGRLFLARPGVAGVPTTPWRPPR